MEPLLRDDFFDIINYSVHHDFFISIDTNGTFIDKFLENLSRSSDVKPYLSRIAFQLSLDGYDSQTHGFIRNNYNHFEIVLSSIQKLKSVGFTVVVETVLHDAILDFDSLYKIFKILSSLKVDKWNVMDIHPILNTKYLKYFIPSPYKIFTAFKALGQISKVSSFPINFPFKGVLGNGKLKGGLMYVCEHDDLGENFAILPDGNVTWCSRLFTSEFLSGNIYVEGFKTVYSKLKKHQIFKMKVSDTLCNKCPYAKYCGAGCRANAYWLEQDIKAKDNIACNYWKVWERLKKEILLNEKI
jgi:radical SAM protein with 4Fe4S-binding SPASM domain